MHVATSRKFDSFYFLKEAGDTCCSICYLLTSALSINVFTIDLDIDHIIFSSIKHGNQTNQTTKAVVGCESERK